MRYVAPGQPGSIVEVAPRYENFIGGKWLAPTHGKYRVDLAPATAGPITEVADSTPEDVELALDAAHAAKDAWGEASAAQRAEVRSGRSHRDPARNRCGSTRGRRRWSPPPAMSWCAAETYPSRRAAPRGG